MEALYKPDVYGPTLALKIEAMGATAVEIANRWILGWPTAVKSLVESGGFFDRLITQTELEKNVMAEAVDLSHLAKHEIRTIYGLSEAP